ncbi:MAG TPA: hypothetical protein VFB60_14050 [Ktedonobacteraceae bacterium]|nr:hypothetical protein [Ktedonobacteraceae bacterium]
MNKDIASFLFEEVQDDIFELDIRISEVSNEEGENQVIPSHFTCDTSEGCLTLFVC